MSNSDRDSLKPTIPSAPARQASARSCSTQVFRRTGSHSVRTFAIGVYGYGGDVVGYRSSAQPSGRLGRRAPIGVTREVARHAPPTSAPANSARPSANNRARADSPANGAGSGAGGGLRGGGGGSPLGGGHAGSGLATAGWGCGGAAAGWGCALAPAGSHTRVRPQTSLAGQGGLHCGTHWPAAQAKPGEQIGLQPSPAATTGRAPDSERRRDERRLVSGGQHPYRVPHRQHGLLEGEHGVGACFTRALLEQKNALVPTPGVGAALHTRRRDLGDQIGGSVEKKTCSSQFGPRLAWAGPTRLTSGCSLAWCAQATTHSTPATTPRPTHPARLTTVRGTCSPASPSSYMRSIERVSSRVMRLARTASSANRRTRATRSSRE